MDFDDTPEQAAFRAACVDWLDANAERRPAEGSAETWKGFRPRTPEEDAAALSSAKEWQLTKADAGYAGIQWPTVDGGRGLSPRHAAIFKECEARYDVPANYFQVGVDMVGPTLIAHADDHQRERHLEGTRRGEQVWCQLFSEPGAGSDLAGLRTRGVRDGDELVIDGQKVWTTGAHQSDWAITLVRTDPDAPRHAGISYVLVDMTTPGIEVRPLRQIDGAIHFNEVFLTEVRVPLTNVVGGLGGGWRVAMTTLTAERSAIGGGGMVQFDEVLQLARTMGVSGDPVMRQRLAQLATMFELTRLMGCRVQTSLDQGRQPGPESSVMKLHISRQYEMGGDLLESIMGAAGMLWADDAPHEGFFQGVFLAQWAPRIGGGTDQIQRNIVGERVLGLPKEPVTEPARPTRAS